MPRRRNAASRPRTTEEWCSHLGDRVTIRYKIHDDPEHDSSEAVGVIQAVRPNETGAFELVIMNRRAESTIVAIDDVTAAKVYPF